MMHRVIFHVGWYEAEVQNSNYDDDEVDIMYPEEPDCCYTISVMPSLMKGKLKIVKSM